MAKLVEITHEAAHSRSARAVRTDHPRGAFPAILAFLGWFLLASAMSSAQATDLVGVRFGPDKDATRVVFDLDGAPTYTVYGDESGEGRLYIDFSALTIRPADKDYRPGKGHIGRYGFAKIGGGGVRAILEFGKTAKIKEIFLLEPKDGVTWRRLVIDLKTADKPAFMASLPSRYGDLTSVIEQATADITKAEITKAEITKEGGAQEKAPGGQAPPDLKPATAPQTASVSPPAEQTPPTPSLKGPSLKGEQLAQGGPRPSRPALKRTIVIDPGHGGRDPGSQGQGGALEKTVTLAAANELVEILEQRGGYEIVLTRDADADAKIKPDQRAELARREALARGAGAKLFISLHADAINQTAVRGASVYTLSETGTARSQNLAKSQGNYQVYDIDLEQYDSIVGGILLDKAQDSTMTSSSKFAELLIANLSSAKTPMLNRSHRKGDLRVLLAPDVPAVLLEMAFISNPKDEANLTSKAWRKRTMSAVADSIDQYFEGLPPSRHAALAREAAQ